MVVHFSPLWAIAVIKHRASLRLQGKVRSMLNSASAAAITFLTLSSPCISLRYTSTYYTSLFTLYVETLLERFNSFDSPFAISSGRLRSARFSGLWGPCLGHIRIYYAELWQVSCLPMVVFGQQLPRSPLTVDIAPIVLDKLLLTSGQGVPVQVQRGRGDVHVWPVQLFV